MSDAIEEAQRRCTRCSGILPLSLFGVSRKRHDGLKPWCKPCSAEHLREWSARNPDKVKARKQRDHAKHSAERNAKSAAWRRRNAESVQAAWDAWHARNPEARRLIALEWAKRNPAALAAQAAARRAAKRSATPPWAASEFDRFVLSEAYVLARARTSATGVAHSVDHIVPLKSQHVCGLHCAANVRVIPDLINKSKNNRHWPDMP